MYHANRLKTQNTHTPDYGKMLKMETAQKTLLKVKRSLGDKCSFLSFWTGTHEGHPSYGVRAICLDKNGKEYKMVLNYVPAEEMNTEQFTHLFHFLNKGDFDS